MVKGVYFLHHLHHTRNKRQALSATYSTGTALAPFETIDCKKKNMDLASVTSPIGLHMSVTGTSRNTYNTQYIHNGVTSEILTEQRKHLFALYISIINSLFSH